MLVLYYSNLQIMLDIVIKNYTLFCLVLKEKTKGTLHNYFYLKFDKKTSDFSQYQILYDGLTCS